MLRYFEKQDLATVGATFGISEDAAQKRVSRALDKLREFLSRRGVKSAAGALAALISANAVQSAPAGLVATVTSSALTAGTLASSNSSLAQIIPSLKTAASVGLIVAVAGLGTRHLKLREELRDAKATVLRLTAELQELRAENQRLAALRIDPEELERLRQQAAEVHRLRAETSRQQRELAAAQAKAAAAFQPAMTNAAPEAMAKAQTQVMLEAKFVEVPDTVLEQIGAGWLAAGMASVNSVLTPDQSRQLLEVLEQKDGVEVLGAPRAITMDGRQAQVGLTQEFTAVTDPVTLTTTNDRVGCIVDMIPRFSRETPNIDLTVVAEVRSRYETVNAQGQPVQEVRPLKTSAFKRLLDGQTLVLREAWGDAEKRVLKRIAPFTETEDQTAATNKGQPVTGPFKAEVPGPRSLLIFVTAQLVDDIDDDGRPLRAAKP